MAEDIKTRLKNEPIKLLLEFPWHCFFFGLLFIILTLQTVYDKVLIEEVIPVTVWSIITIPIVFALYYAFIRKFYKAAVVTTLTVIFFFAYKSIEFSFTTLYKLAFAGAAPEPWLILLVVLSLSTLCILAASKNEWEFRGKKYQSNFFALSQALNAASLLLVLMNGVPLAYTMWQQESTSAELVKEYESKFKNLAFDKSGTKPDVYYMILDGFAHEQTLHEYFDCKYDKLYRYLEDKGFYVVPDAVSNYDRTIFSLSSSLNMQYIDSVPEKLGRNNEHVANFNRMISDNSVFKIFKKLGYKFYTVASYDSPLADYNYNPGYYNQFLIAAMQLTPFSSIEDYWPVLRDFVAETRLAADKALPQIVKQKSPKFVLVHSEISHSPTIFKADGTRLPLPKGFWMIDWGTREQLRGQVSYSQDKAVNWLDTIFNAYGENKPVVIVQADHGPGVVMEKHQDWWNERMRILNAYYFPDKNYSKLYPKISPVNSFRVIFNKYFQTKLPMLPDKAMSPEKYEDYFNWQDVTPNLRFNSKPQSEADEESKISPENK